jgi:hypothetical protein
MKDLMELYKMQAEMQRTLLDSLAAASCSLTMTALDTSTAMARSWLDCQQGVIGGMVAAVYPDHLRRPAPPRRMALRDRPALPALPKRAAND